MLRKARRHSLLLNRADDKIRLTVKDQKGSRCWKWALSDLQSAEVNTRRRSGTELGSHRPDLILTDGGRIPIRAYHAAGMQSWHAVASVKLFLGQTIDNRPVGSLPPAGFDRYFHDEMAQFRRKN